MRMHPTPALRRLRPEDDIDRLARQRGRIDRFREPRMIVGVDRGQQTPMIDQRGLDADSEQRMYIPCDLRNAVVAFCRATRLEHHRRQIRGHLLQPLGGHAASLAFAVHAPIAERVHQRERQQDQRGRHQPVQC
ncbi:hypothetical protein G6F31_012334 [Rhizopus arrhizus]|nr:hypothetical protein G6F31_012334 [Rhizopus arrhizus]